MIFSPVIFSFVMVLIIWLFIFEGFDTSILVIMVMIQAVGITALFFVESRIIKTNT